MVSEVIQQEVTTEPKTNWLIERDKNRVLLLATICTIIVGFLLTDILRNDLAKEFQLIKPITDVYYIIFNWVFYYIPIILTPLWLFPYLLVGFLQKRKVNNKLAFRIFRLYNFFYPVISKIDKFTAYSTISNITKVFVLYTPCILVANTVLLINALLSRSLGATTLLKDASIIWVSNIILFGLIYWLIDDGGPVKRKLETFCQDNFTFPEITTLDKKDWKPNFFDYFYLSFNICTSFSVTDHNAVTRGAKACVIIQSLISFISVGVFFARAINILTV